MRDRTGALTSPDSRPTTLVAAGHIAGRRILRVATDPHMRSDDYLRARHREDRWPDAIPAAERRTCRVHDDWVDHCAHLHQEAA